MEIKFFFWINIILFIIHEMDAVRTREWEMIIFTDRLKEEYAYRLFTLLHFPLFFLIFYFADRNIHLTFIVTSSLLILHQFLHLIFIKHTLNRMNNFFSRLIIFLMFLNSLTGLVFYAAMI